jgi:hypothetical protein
LDFLGYILPTMPTIYLSDKPSLDAKIAELEAQEHQVHLVYQAVDGSWVVVYFATVGL